MTESVEGKNFQDQLISQEIQVLGRLEVTDELNDILTKMEGSDRYSAQTHFINDMVKHAFDLRDMELLVDGKNKSFRLKDTNPFLEEIEQAKPVFHIRNNEKFSKAIDSLAQSLEGNTTFSKQHLLRWIQRQTLSKLWLNATPDDFEHPERFAEHQAYLLGDTTFDDLQDKEVALGTLNSLDQPLVVTQRTPIHEFESPHELEFKVGIDESDAIHAVRFGIIEPNTAVVYAVQMPPKRGLAYDYSENLVDQSMKDGKRFSDIDLYETKEMFEKRRENMKRFNPFLGRKVDPSNPDSKIPEDLVGVSPAAVVSLTAALEMFRERGINTIRIPTFIPWRQHDEQFIPNKFGGIELDEQGRIKFKDESEIDKRILEQVMKLVQRVEYEVDGVEVTSFGEGDHYIQLKLGNELTSKRPILQEVIQSVQTGLPKPEEAKH